MTEDNTILVILAVVILLSTSILFLGLVAATSTQKPDCIRDDHTMKEISVMVYEQGEKLKKCQ